MHSKPCLPPVDIRLSEAEAIALDYFRAAGRDGWVALVRAIEDALADLDTAEHRMAEQGRLISRGYARRHPLAN